MIKETIEKVSKIFPDKYISLDINYSIHTSNPKITEVSWRLYIQDREEGGHFPTFDALKKYVDELDVAYISEQQLIEEMQ